MPARFLINDDTYRLSVASLGKRSQEGIESIRNLLGVDWEDEVTVTPIKIGTITVEAHIKLEGVGPDGELIEMISRPSNPNYPQIYVDGLDLEWSEQQHSQARSRRSRDKDWD